MPNDDIDQAALAARWGDAEPDLVEVISRALGEPRVTVERVLFAASAAFQDDVARCEPPDEQLRDAIRSAMERGLRRVIVRRAIAASGYVRVALKAIVKDDLGRVCNGCPVSMACVARSLSTPAKCLDEPLALKFYPNTDYRIWRDSYGGASARPVRLRGDALRVECAHPCGTWDVDIMDVVA